MGLMVTCVVITDLLATANHLDLSAVERVLLKVRHTASINRYPYLLDARLGLSLVWISDEVQR